jgi:septal ring factor EnvC (AmiA/AmiB activator)
MSDNYNFPIRHKFASAAAAVALAWCTVGAQEADNGRTEALARRAAERLQALHEEADHLAAEERSLLGDLRRLELEREIKDEEFHQADGAATKIARDLAAIDGQIGDLEAQDAVAKPALRARILGLYKVGQGRYARMLLSISDLRRVGEATRMIGALATRDRERIAEHQRRLQQLATSRVSLTDHQHQLARQRAAADRARAAAERAIDARNALIHDIDQRRDLNAALVGELQSAQQKLQSTLANVAPGAAAEPVSLPIAPFRGSLEWPVAGAVRQRFQHGATAVNGIDIAAAEGVPVQAIHDGVVAFADTFAGFGRLVILDHGGQTFSLYGNLASLDVEKGARIEQGLALGTVGVAPTGAAGLYFELRVEGRPVDPQLWLRKR